MVKMLRRIVQAVTIVLVLPFALLVVLVMSALLVMGGIDPENRCE